MFKLSKKTKKYLHYLKYTFQKFTNNDDSQTHDDLPYLKEIFRAFKIVTLNEVTKEIDNDFRILKSYYGSLEASSEVIDFSILEKGFKKKVSAMVSGVSPEIWCKLYYMLTREINASKVLEIGTNLGVSGQYFIKALERSGQQSPLFVTMEGVADLCRIAGQRFKEIAGGGVEYKIIEGLYDDNLNLITSSNNKYDIVFIDGNHQYSSTLKYFEVLKNNFSDKAIIIFDDINWSKGMQMAWEKVKNDPNTDYSIDLFKLGIILYNRNSTTKTKKHFNLFLSLK